jgi:uncharacterized protein (TIGR02145 family)
MIKLRSYIVKILFLSLLILPSVRCHKNEDKPENDPCAFHMSTYMIHCIVNYPASGAIIKSTSLTLKWIATTPNPTYDLSLGTDKENMKMISQQAANSYTLNNLEKGKTYYWSFNAINECKKTCFSGIGSFTVIPDTNLPFVTTAPIPVHLNNSAPLGGNVLYEGLYPVTERGAFWGTLPEPEKTGSRITNGMGLGQFSSLMEGLGQTTQYYTRAYATNSYGTSYGTEIKFTTGLSASFGSVSDIDGRIYKTIRIGTQVWMAENLKTTKLNDGTPVQVIADNNNWGSYPISPRLSWYNNDSTTYNSKYGVLYNGAAIITGKLCPVGWHIPTDEEWKTLEIYLGMSEKVIASENVRETDQGSQMKSTTGWTDQLNCFNTSNFSGVPGGIRMPLGTFIGEGQLGEWWSSTKDLQLDFYWSRYLKSAVAGVGREVFSIQAGCSVRCVKN